MIDGIRQAIVSLEERMDRRFAAIDQRFTAIDERFAAIDRRFAMIDQRFVGIDQRFLGLDQRLSSIDDKMSRQFHWAVGVQMTTFVVTIATILTAMLAR